MEFHNNGYEKLTSKGTPWKLAWSCSKPTKKEAFVLERKLKNLNSQKKAREFIAKYA